MAGPKMARSNQAFPLLPAPKLSTPARKPQPAPRPIVRRPAARKR